MNFNHNCSKQAQQIISSKKLKWKTHPLLIVNNSNVSQAFFSRTWPLWILVWLLKNTLIVYLTKQTKLYKHLFTKNLYFGFFQNSLPRQALISIYNAFVRPHLNYDNAFYDQVFDNYFCGKLELVQDYVKRKNLSRVQSSCLQLYCFFQKNFVNFIKSSKTEHPKYILISFLE